MSKYILGKSMPDFLSNFGDTLHLPGCRFTGVPLFVRTTRDAANFDTTRWVPVTAERLAPELFCDTIAGCIAAMNAYTGGDTDTMILDRPVTLRHGTIERIKSDSDGNSFLYSGSYQNGHNGYELTPTEKYAVYHAVFDKLRVIERAVKESGRKTPEIPSRMEPPLRVAAMEGNAARVRDIIATGTPVDTASRYGMTALHLAANYGHPECVAALIAAGANVNAADDLGRTPLHMTPGVMMDTPKAELEKRARCAAMLIAAGADINRADNAGRKPDAPTAAEYEPENAGVKGQAKKGQAR